jgi:hypothetical protein
MGSVVGLSPSLNDAGTLRSLGQFDFDFAIHGMSNEDLYWTEKSLNTTLGSNAGIVPDMATFRLSAKASISRPMEEVSLIVFEVGIVSDR